MQIFIDVKYINHLKGIHMLDFLKKLVGLPTKEEVKAAKEQSVPYKVEPPVVNNKTGDVVDFVLPVEVKLQNTVSTEVTESVQVTPVKKPRKPRTTKAEKLAKEKTTKVKKTASEKKARKVKSS